MKAPGSAQSGGAPGDRATRGTGSVPLKTGSVPLKTGSVPLRHEPASTRGSVPLKHASRSGCALVLLLLVFTPVDSSWWSMGSLSPVVCAQVPGLVRRQRQLCQRNPELMRSVSSAAQDWIRECQHQLTHQRWNCSVMERDSSVFGRVMLRSSREAAFVYAISSAGVVHAIARACSRGELSVCGCGDAGQKRGGHASREGGQKRGGQKRGGQKRGGRASRDHRGDFDWGGCGDDVDYAVRFAKAFVDARERAEKDARALINLHNNRCGRMAVKRFMKLQCKCHGVSGSCALRTCWLAMSDFRRTGDFLRRKYDTAAQATVNQDGAGFTVTDRRDPGGSSRNELVFVENSPDYCLLDRNAGSLGTAGRVCSKSSRGAEGCEVMCCGRGYDTARVTRVAECECKFRWCCAVECRECEETVDVHTCKKPHRRADWLDLT